MTGLNNKWTEKLLNKKIWYINIQINTLINPEIDIRMKFVMARYSNLKNVKIFKVHFVEKITENHLAAIIIVMLLL